MSEKLSNVKGDSYYGKRAQNYNNRRNKQDWWHIEHKEMCELLDKLPKGLKVVDVPFGTGRFVNEYLARDYKVHGLDASDHMLKAAEQDLGAEFKKCTTKCGLSTALPYKDNEFDLLVSTRFLRDIITYEDAQASLAEFSRVNSRYAIIQLGEWHGKKGRLPKPTERMSSLMDAAQNEKLLKSYGYKILEKRLVHTTDEELAPAESGADTAGDEPNSHIYHFLCEK